MKNSCCIAMLCGLLAVAPSALARPLPKEVRERSASVEGIYNDHARFVVRVDVDHPDHVYVDGDTLQATVKSERAGYLYLLYENVQGQTVCLFPNRYQADNRIRKNELVQVPGPEANFRIRIHAPLGREVLKAVISPKPLAANELSVRTLSEGVAQPVSERGVRDASVELAAAAAHDWAEHQVEITTVAKRPGPKQTSRYAVIVALAHYQDSDVPALPACAKDAELMKQIYQDHGQMDDTVVLSDERATRANVEKLFRILAQSTKQGDEIFIYWTGHGASVADTHGESSNGMEGVLVTYDTSRDNIGQTGVSESVLRRWLQDLDGRRVIFLLDVCLAGNFAGKGMAERSPLSELKGDDNSSDAAKKSLSHFFEGLFVQTKAIGQKETALLCSSAGTESSLVRRDGASSVMTGFLVDFIRQSDRSVSLQAAYDYVKVEVPKYVREHYSGVDQQPQFLDNLSSPAYIRP